MSIVNVLMHLKSAPNDHFFYSVVFMQIHLASALVPQSIEPVSVIYFWYTMKLMNYFQRKILSYIKMYNIMDRMNRYRGATLKVVVVGGGGGGDD